MVNADNFYNFSEINQFFLDIHVGHSFLVTLMFNANSISPVAVREEELVFQDGNPLEFAGSSTAGNEHFRAFIDASPINIIVIEIVKCFLPPLRTVGERQRRITESKPFRQ